MLCGKLIDLLFIDKLNIQKRKTRLVLAPVFFTLNLKSFYQKHYIVWYIRCYKSYRTSKNILNGLEYQYGITPPKSNKNLQGNNMLFISTKDDNLPSSFGKEFKGEVLIFVISSPTKTIGSVKLPPKRGQQRFNRQTFLMMICFKW